LLTYDPLLTLLYAHNHEICVGGPIAQPGRATGS
jgi:hypothetical protein